MSRPDPAILVRPATLGDLPACGSIWHAGLDDYGRRVGRYPMPAPGASFLELLGHLLATDPERFLVAVRPDPDAGPEGRVVAFASAVRREHVWFLAMLFVDPIEQSHGLGRLLLERVLPPGGDEATLATCTDSAQPISNALYARYGIVPRVPVLELVGRPEGLRPPPLPGDVRAVPFEVLAPGDPAGPGGRLLAAALAMLDRGSLGYAHPEDHAYLAATGRLGYLYQAGDGEVLAYGYVGQVGRLGPVAVSDPALLAPVLGHLLGAVEPAGAFFGWIPGPAGEAITGLLQAGLRIEDFPALLCWSRPFGDFSRYIPINLAFL